MQGAVVNVVTRQGSNRFLYDASYYGQPAGLTSQPVPSHSWCRPTDQRVRARPVPRRHDEPRWTSRSGAAVVLRGIPVSARLRQSTRRRPEFPEDLRAEQDLREAHVATGSGVAAGSERSRRALGQPELPTSVKPFEATLYQHASVPAITFGHLTHTSSANTVWDVRVGRFVYSQESSPSSGNRGTPSRLDSVTGVTSGAPQQVGAGSRFARPPRRPSATTGPGCGAPITSGRSAGSSTGARTGRSWLFRLALGTSTTMGNLLSRPREIPPTPAVSSSRPPRSRATP